MGVLRPGARVCTTCSSTRLLELQSCCMHHVLEDSGELENDEAMMLEDGEDYDMDEDDEAPAAGTTLEGPHAEDASTTLEGPQAEDASTALEGPHAEPASTALEGPHAEAASTTLEGPHEAEAASTTPIASKALAASSQGTTDMVDQDCFFN